MNIFEIEGGPFNTRAEFHHYLSEKYEDIVDGNLYICAGITDHSADKFIEEIEVEGWEIAESHGHIKQIAHKHGEARAKAYLSFDDDKGVFFLYTDQRKNEEIDEELLRLLRDTDGVHYLYIGPRIIRDLCQEIGYEWESSKVTTFIAKRTPGTEIDAKRRPDTRRTINYYGDDGMEALGEVERDYGVLPHTVEIQIPTEIRFRVNKEGVFALKSGKMTTLFDYMEICIRQTLAMKQEYDTSDFSILEAGNGYKIPESKPATIELSHTLSPSTLQEVRESVNNGGYTMLDTYFDASAVTLSAKVFDSNENLFFNLEVTPNKIRVFPREESKMAVFLRFFEFVQSEIDDRASPKHNLKSVVVGEEQ